MTSAEIRVEPKPHNMPVSAELDSCDKFIIKPDGLSVHEKHCVTKLV